MYAAANRPIIVLPNDVQHECPAGTNAAVQDGSRLSRGLNVAVAALRATALQQKLIGKLF